MFVDCPAPPAPTVTVKATPEVTLKPVAVKNPPAPPPPPAPLVADDLPPPPPPPAMTKYSTVGVTGLAGVIELDAADVAISPVVDVALTVNV
jgi:hypothetical protein